MQPNCDGRHTMAEYADIYALSAQRTEEFVDAFAARFMPEREETADEFEVPQYARPEQVFRASSELIRYCCQRPAQVHAVYWRNVHDSEPAHAMVFFLPDGYVVFGLSVRAHDELSVQRLFAELRSFVGTADAYVAHEALPGATAEEFRCIARQREP